MTRHKIKQVIYRCPGECGITLTEEDFRKHTTGVCGDSTCSHFALPFARRDIYENVVRRERIAARSRR